MDPNKVKHVTEDNVTSEDIKPEGRTDGPKNFGPEFVTGPGGVVRPTRPAEQVERVARAVAEGARADGKDEGEVAKSFAAALPEGVAAVPATAKPVPSIVLASMPQHAREEHEKKLNKKRNALSVADQMQYDIGVGLAQDSKALPLEASDSLEEGYEDTRTAMQEELQLRRERESSDLLEHKPKAEQRKTLKEREEADGKVTKVELVQPGGGPAPGA